jgi:hypothetical protein
MTEQPQAAPKLSIGKMVDEMYALRNQKLELNKKAKEINARIEELQSLVLERMEGEDMEVSAGQDATARRAKTIVPVVQDWTAFEKYIMDNDALYMLERRCASNSFRELNAQGVEVPGVRPFTKIAISLTKKSKG